MGFFSLRRVRVRREYAHLYPRIVPETWISVRRTVRTIRRSNPEARERELKGERILLEEHFEFRGGPRQSPERRDARTRATDLRR
jgi:hypothetical protein